MKAFLAVFLSFHFLMIILGIGKITLPTKFLADRQHDYGRLTGAAGSYAFFSPNVPRELVVEFEIDRPNSSKLTTDFRNLHAPEVRARLGNMIRLMEKHYKDERVLRSVAASLSASVYRRFPDAESIRLNSFVYQMPTMREYREGKRPALKPVYSAKFYRRET